ncbi:MAG: PAS domain-containing sensor histidine kinase [Gemmatimonadaceae bacterium]|nr:PAS domain-containing sensor histidine kinase [Gemmatimonadaceae bacterium]
MTTPVGHRSHEVAAGWDRFTREARATPAALLAGAVLLLIIVGVILLIEREHPSLTVGLVVGSMLATATGLGGMAFGRLSSDLSTLRRATDLLRASEARYSGILSVAVDAIIVLDVRFRITAFNEGAERIFGWTAAELEGQPLSVLLPERFRHGHEAMMAAFAAGPVGARRMGERREISGVRKSGEEFPAEASISNGEGPNGRFLTAVLRDISERRRAERDDRFLSSTSGELATTLEAEATQRAVAHMPVPHLAPMAVLDLVAADGSYSRLVAGGVPDARPRPPIIGRPLTADSPSAVIDVLRVGATRQVDPLTDEWWEGHTATQEKYDAWRGLGARALLIVPLVAREHVVGAFTLLRFDRGFDAKDVALAEELALRGAFAIDNARLYHTARVALQARDDVLGVVSHDLRNPLAAIRLCTKALVEHPPEDPAARAELLRTISDSTEWMGRLIRDLLDVANLEGGRFPLEKRREAARVLLEDAQQLFAALAQEKGVTLSVDVGTEAVVDVDRARLQQVLSNLIHNALKYTDVGGRIVVRTERRERELLWTIADTGTGIPAEQLPHIFARYWTARRSAKDGGTGLGLAIAHGIVEAHGGRMWAESTVGVGTTLSFSLPLAG